MPHYIPNQIHQYGLPGGQRVLGSIHLQLRKGVPRYSKELWDTLQNHAKFMLTLFCHSRTFKIGMGLIEALAKIFFSSIPVWWRRMRKTNSVLCICGGCGLWITLSYGGKAKIPSQIEIEKSILGQTAQLIPNQFRGRILSGHPVQGFEQNGL